MRRFYLFPKKAFGYGKEKDLSSTMIIALGTKLCLELLDKISIYTNIKNNQDANIKHQSNMNKRKFKDCCRLNKFTRCFFALTLIIHSYCYYYLVPHLCKE